MTAVTFDKDFYSDAFILDPIPQYAEMRKAGPVLWLPQNNCYAVARYSEVIRVLRGDRVFLSGAGLSLNEDVNRLLVGSTLNSDGDAHDLQRSVTAPPIMPKNIQPLEDYIHRTAESLADRLVAMGRFDAIRDFATVLPLSIVVDLVGLNDQGKERMLTWASAAFNLFEGFNARSQAAFEDLRDLQTFLSQYGTADDFKEGGLARRVFDVAPDKGFTEAQAAQLLRDYINPSLDTTVSAAGFAVYYFAQQPEQWEALRADATLIPNAVEEIIRLATPIRAFSRLVGEDTELEGVALPQGARILAIYASANRDAEVWDNPDQFDVTRAVRKHIGFGHGKHTCMGLHLARRELINLIGAMLPRVKQWHFDGPAEIAMNNTIRAFASLPVRVDVDG